MQTQVELMERYDHQVPKAGPPASGYFDSAFLDGVPIASQTFTYDAFGNINKTGSPYSFNPSSYLNNRMSQIGNCTPSYDANGNVLYDCLNSYTWDAYGRPLTVNGVTLTYDALGRMVEQNRSGAYTEVVYSPSGFKMELMNGMTNQKSFVPLPGGSSAVYNNAAGVMYIRHPDWLGNGRLTSTSSQQVYGDVSYAPFGETYSQSGGTDFSFTGINQDTNANVYDFPAREYGIQGRWPSPDPAGLAAAKPSNPQSWNRYAYVRNSPLAAIDPSGLMMTVSGGGGGGGGGMLSVYNGSWAADAPAWDPISLYIGDDITPVNAALYAGNYALGGGLLATVSFGNFEVDPATGTYDGFAQETISFSTYSFVTTTPDGWIPHSPLPARPDTTVTDQKKLQALKVAGMKASHDLGCVANAEAGMIPFVGSLFDDGSSTSLDGADNALGVVGNAGIVASFFNNRFSAFVEHVSGGLAPVGTAVSTVNGAIKANACIDNGPESSGF